MWSGSSSPVSGASRSPGRSSTRWKLGRSPEGAGRWPRCSSPNWPGSAPSSPRWGTIRSVTGPAETSARSACAWRPSSGLPGSVGVSPSSMLPANGPSRSWASGWGRTGPTRSPGAFLTEPTPCTSPPATTRRFATPAGRACWWPPLGSSRSWLGPGSRSTRWWEAVATRLSATLRATSSHLREWSYGRMGGRVGDIAPRTGSKGPTRPLRSPGPWSTPTAVGTASRQGLSSASDQASAWRSRWLSPRRAEPPASPGAGRTQASSSFGPARHGRSEAPGRVSSGQLMQRTDRVQKRLPVGLDDVLEAARRLDGVAIRTPVFTSRTLDERVGARIFLKAENFQRGGAFKFRGAYNKISSLRPGTGVASYSSGNHAQAVALAASLVGSTAVIVMPRDAPEQKVEATRGDGAEVVFYDRYSEDRDEIGRRLAVERGLTLVPPYEDPFVMAGQGTASLELLEGS